MEILQQIANQLKTAKQVAIFTHMRPDGDALGSSLALSCALEYLGIANEVCVETDLPSNLRFINGLEKVKKAPEKEYDVLITLDCSDEQRLGALGDEFMRAKRKKDTYNVDHHVSNTRYAKVNFVRECSANCMNVAKLIEYMGAPIDKRTAEYLLLGLLTDSGNFSHDDVNEEGFLLAAELVKAGAMVVIADMNFAGAEAAAQRASPAQAAGTKPASSAVFPVLQAYFSAYAEES